MLEIHSKSHTYCVEVVETLEQAISRAVKDNVFTLVDSNVLRLYPEPFAHQLNPNRLLSVEATEEQKAFEQLTPIFHWLLDSGCKRDCTLLVVGGGVLQDIGCFIASVIFRGMKWELIPTTLLAQCDSCIGSKSSINIGNFKNQIGTFYPPHHIYMVFGVLATLPPDEIRSGLGEIIKLHLIAGTSAFDKLKQNLLRYQEEQAVIQEMVLDSLHIKKAFIEQDEFDRGVRNLLNYGHTFGHAYESATDYSIPHGIAVTLGIATATFFSERLGMLPPGDFENLNGFLEPYYQPYDKVVKAENNLEKILGAIKLDKKNTGNKINCILTRQAGCMEKVPLGVDNLQPLLTDFLKTL